MTKNDSKLDLAARAAWLYYVSGNTQEEIATKLKVSRPAAQRLIAKAMEEGLVKVRINHPIATCYVLADQLRKRFDLEICDVVPSNSESGSDTHALAIAGAAHLESAVCETLPSVIALGTGRTLRAVVDEMSTVDRPQHRFVSLVGNLARDGSSNPYDTVMHIADKTGGKPFLLPAPVMADTAQQRRELVEQRLFRSVREVTAAASIAFVGIAEVSLDAPLLRDGFLTADEVRELLRLGAVGEILGWTFDKNGKLINSTLNERITSRSLESPPLKPMIAIAGGQSKIAAIRGALLGHWISGLITDEVTATRVLEGI